MNKKKLKLVFASAFALMVGCSIYTKQQKIEMSDLAMANVEALASGESSEICKWKRVKDDYGNIYHACLSNGDGDKCSCGSIIG